MHVEVHVGHGRCTQSTAGKTSAKRTGLTGLLTLVYCGVCVCVCVCVCVRACAEHTLALTAHRMPAARCATVGSGDAGGTGAQRPILRAAHQTLCLRLRF